MVLSLNYCNTNRAEFATCPLEIEINNGSMSINQNGVVDIFGQYKICDNKTGALHEINFKELLMGEIRKATDKLGIEVSGNLEIYAQKPTP